MFFLLSLFAEGVRDIEKDFKRYFCRCIVNILYDVASRCGKYNIRDVKGKGSRR